MAGTVLALLFVLPLLWVIVRSLEPPVLTGQAPSAADFTHMTVSNYSTLLVTDNVLINLLNSLIAALGTAALTVVVSTMAGYGLARFSFRFAGLVFAAILLAFMIPFQAVLTPLFLELHFFHLLNSLFGLVLVYSTFSLPFGVFVMRNTFSQIPGELVDSSRVDGAGVMTALVRVMRPLVVPGMATTAIYAFLYAWTELLQAYTFLTSNNLMTLPVKLFNVMTQQSLGVLNYGYLAVRGRDRHGPMHCALPGPAALLRPGLDFWSTKGLIAAFAGAASRARNASFSKLRFLRRPSTARWAR